jgi:hypothetical protein
MIGMDDMKRATKIDSGEQIFIKANHSTEIAPPKLIPIKNPLWMFP